MAILRASSQIPLSLPLYCLLSVLLAVWRPTVAVENSLADVSATLDTNAQPQVAKTEADAQAEAAARLVEAVRVRRLIELLKKRKRRHQAAIAAAAAAAASAESTETELDVEPAAAKSIRSVPLRLKSLAPSLSQNREILGWERLGWGW